MKPSDQPLVARIEGQHLVIRIGIGTMAFCSEAVNGGVLSEDTHVVKKREWARDVIYAILDEDEDGSNLLTDMLDAAQKEASENGSTSLRFPGFEPETGKQVVRPMHAK